MKKSIKIILALVLSIIISLSSISAFATESIEYDYWQPGENAPIGFSYAGEISVGENNLTISYDNYYPYYSLDIEEAGYYAIYDTGEVFDYFIPQNINNGIAYTMYNNSYYTENGWAYIYYFDTKDYFIGLWLENNIEKANITVEYYGNELTSVNIGDELIIDYDYFFYSEPDSEYWCDIYNYVEYTFSSGKKLHDYSASGYPVNPDQKGKNIINIAFLDDFFQAETTLIEISDIISDVEITNIDKYTNVKGYYNSIDATLPYDETEKVTIVLTDGTRLNAPYDYHDYNGPYVKLPNGKIIDFYFLLEEIDGKWYINIYAGNALVKGFECKSTTATFKENLNKYNQDNKDDIYDIKYWLKQAILSITTCNNINELLNFGFDNAIDDLKIATNRLLNMYENTVKFFEYYNVQNIIL